MEKVLMNCNEIARRILQNSVHYGSELSYSLNIHRHQIRDIPSFILNEWTDAGTMVIHSTDGYVLLPYGSRDPQLDQKLNLGFIAPLKERHLQELERVLASYNKKLNWLKEIQKGPNASNDSLIDMEKFKEIGTDKESNIINLKVQSITNKMKLRFIPYSIHHPFGVMIAELKDGMVVFPIKEVDVNGNEEIFGEPKIYKYEEINCQLKEEILYAEKEIEETIQLLTKMHQSIRLRAIFNQ